MVLLQCNCPCDFQSREVLVVITEISGTVKQRRRLYLTLHCQHQFKRMGIKAHAEHESSKCLVPLKSSHVRNKTHKGRSKEHCEVSVARMTSSSPTAGGT